MDPTCGVVDKFRDIMLNLTWKQLLYLIYYHRNIDQLNKQLMELTLERSSIQRQIDEARNNVYRIEEKVLHWLGEVDELSKQAQKFLEEERQAKTECSMTSCPNLWLRYKLSKRAKAMKEEGANIYSKRSFDRIAYRINYPIDAGSTNRGSNDRIDSRVSIMNQILEALRNPDVNMIGLCGPGGVGKTTIANEVANNQKIFEKVIMATVSQELNIEKIQGQIAEKLSMQLNENNKDVRAFYLCKRLKEEKNMLLILDDLWEELDLGEVGIPFVSVENCREKIEGCKILLTSRNKTLLSHLMKCQKIVDVGDLSQDEAWELFKKICELSTDSSGPELISMATDIVQKCGGLPLAIATTAKALRKKDVNEWKDALVRLNNPFRRNNTLTRDVDTILKWSYDRLSSSEYKQIFLLSAMLSHDLSIEDLLMYSVGLDILDGIENMEDAHVGVSAAVSKLKSLNLLLDSISSHHVTIHDVFRDVALPIASDELHSFIRRRLKEWPDENMLQGREGICLQESDISVLPDELHCERLQFFMLNSAKRDLSIPSMFFKSSKELKMLAFTNMHFSSLLSLIFLHKLKALCLHSCLLEDISELRSLKNLKVLSLAYSEIQRLPIELVELTSLQMLNLSHCSKLEVIPQKLLSGLKKLEVLYMGNSFNQWKVEESCAADENASLHELIDLPISSLEIHIPNLSMLPEDLFLKMNLRRYRIFIGKRWKWEGNYETSKILKLELESTIYLTVGLQELLKGVDDLHLYGSNGQENVLYNVDVNRFPCLKHLHIENNDDIKYIVMTSARHEDAFPILERLILTNMTALKNLCEGPNDIVFHRLHTLKMKNLPALIGDFSINDGATKNTSHEIFKSLLNKVLLPKLEILELYALNSSIPFIWDEQLRCNSFCNLKTLKVISCGFVKLMPLYVMKYLNNLEELEVRKCDKLENMFDSEYSNDYEEMVSPVIVALKKLKLQNLPRLKNVWSNNCQGNREAVTADLCIQDGATNNTSNKISESLFNEVLFPRLEILELSYLNNSIALIWDNQLSHNSFTNLKTLMVESCGFVKLVPLHVLKCLKNLEELEVRECRMLEMVFYFEDLNDYKEMESSSVVLPMKELKLLRLPKLKNVWSDCYQGNFSFPSIMRVDVSNCERIKFQNNVWSDQCGVDAIVAKDQVSESGDVTFEFRRLTSLVLFDLPRLRNFYPQNHILEWPHLNLLSIQFCDELEIFRKGASCSSEIYEEENILDSKYPLIPRDKVLGKLEQLTLQGKQVEMIGSGQFVMHHFPKLKLLHLSLETWPSLLHWVSSSLLEGLRLSGNVEKALERDNVAALAARFPKLTLNNISIMGSLSPFLVSSPNLTHLEVKSCHNFTTLMTSSIARGLVHLTHLSVCNCFSMEEIVTMQEGEDNENKEIIFIKLKVLELVSLSELKRFCAHNYTFRFPLLNKFVVKVCPKFQRFSPGLIDTPALGSVQLLQHWSEGHHEIWDTNLNKTFYQQRYVTSRELELDEDDAIMIRNDQFPEDCCPQVEILGIEGFVREWVTFPYTLLGRFPKLNELRVQNCSFEQIFPTQAPSSSSFHCLTVLKVSKCHQLVYLVTTSTVKTLVNLETLEIDHCEKLEEIVRNETNEDVERGITFNGLRILRLCCLPKLKTQEYKKNFNSEDVATNNRCTDISRSLLSHTKVLLPKLERLELSSVLNNLISLIWDDQLLHNSFSNLKTLIVRRFDSMKSVPFRVLKSLSNLEKLEVKNCDKLEMVFGYEDSDGYLKEMEPSSMVVPLSLTHLEVKGCRRLTTLMTSSIAQSLVHLTHLSISYCDQIKEIITKQEGEDDEDKEIIFNQMKVWELERLPRLKRFCAHNYTFRFPLLDKFVTTECPKFKRFSPGLIHTPTLRSVHRIEKHHEIWDTNLSKTFYQ